MASDSRRFSMVSGAGMATCYCLSNVVLHSQRTSTLTQSHTPRSLLLYCAHCHNNVTHLSCFLGPQRILCYSSDPLCWFTRTPYSSIMGTWTLYGVNCTTCCNLPSFSLQVVPWQEASCEREERYSQSG